MDKLVEQAIETFGRIDILVIYYAQHDHFFFPKNNFRADFDNVASLNPNSDEIYARKRTHKIKNDSLIFENFRATENTFARFKIIKWLRRLYSNK